MILRMVMRVRGMLGVKYGGSRDNSMESTQ